MAKAKGGNDQNVGDEAGNAVNTPTVTGVSVTSDPSPDNSLTGTNTDAIDVDQKEVQNSKPGDIIKVKTEEKGPDDGDDSDLTDFKEEHADQAKDNAHLA